MLTYITRGEGREHVVLLHGFLGSGRNLASLARLWAQRDPHKRFVLPDLTGHGASKPLPPEADLEALAADVLALIDGIGIETPVPIVGHSLGGRVALVARALAPQKIGTVALLDIAPGPIPKHTGDLEPVLDALLAAPDESPSREPLRHFFLQRGVSAGLADWLLMNLVSRDDKLHWRIDRQALAELNQRSRHQDLWDTLAKSASPTFCVRGGRSAFVSDADVARFEALGVRVHTLEGAGHFVHVDAQTPLLDILGEAL